MWTSDSISTVEGAMPRIRQTGVGVQVISLSVTLCKAETLQILHSLTYEHLAEA